MEVDVKYGNPFSALVPKCLGTDRGIVDEAVAAVHVRRGVMARWSAQCKRRFLSLRHEFLGGQRDVDACPCSLPGAVTDRSFHGQAVVAHLTLDMGRYPLLHAPHRHDSGYGLAFESHGFPFFPAVLQKLDEFRFVDAVHVSNVK